jgi:hypothetical protein
LVLLALFLVGQDVFLFFLDVFFPPSECFSSQADASGFVLKAELVCTEVAEDEDDDEKEELDCTLPDDAEED